MPDASTAYSVAAPTSNSLKAHLPVESAVISRRVQAPAPSLRTSSSVRSDENPFSWAVTSWSPPLAMVALPGKTRTANAEPGSEPAQGVMSTDMPVRSAVGPRSTVTVIAAITAAKARPADLSAPPSTRLPDSAPRMPSRADRMRRAPIPPAAMRSASRWLRSTAVTKAPPSERSCSST
jgi:hypothetical protein